MWITSLRLQDKDVIFKQGQGGKLDNEESD